MSSQAKIWHTTALVVVMAAIAITPFLFAPLSRELFEWPKIIWIYGLAILSAALLLWAWLVRLPIPVPSRWLATPLFLYLATFIVSTILSMSPYTSIMGYYTRWHGGLASLAAYLLVAWLTLTLVATHRHLSVHSDNSQKPQPSPSPTTLLILTWVLAATTISSIAVLEHFGIGATCWILQGNWQATCWVQDVQARVFATFGQPNWLAAYLLTSLPLALVGVLRVKDVWTKALFWLCLVIQFAALWYTFSRAGWVGLGVLVLLLALCLPWSSLRQNKYWLASLAVVCGLVVASTLNMTANRTATSLESGDFDSSTGHMRLLVWQSSLKLIPQHPVFGSGPETFPYAFLSVRPSQMNTTTEWNFLYNKAHNELLQIATDRGLVGLASWLWLWVAVLVWAWRKDIIKINGPSDHHRLTALALLSGLMATTAAQFFGFSVVMTSLLAWISLALMLESSHTSWLRGFTISHRPYLEIDQTLISSSQSLALSRLLVAVIATIALILASWSLWRYGRAEILSTTASKSSLTDNLLFGWTHQATRLNPYEPYYHQQQAAFYAQQALVSDQQQDQLINQSLQAARQAESLNPNNLITKKQLAPTFAQLAQIKPDLVSQEIDLWRRATSLAPTDAASWQSLAQVLAKHNQPAQAEAAMRTYKQLRSGQ